MDDRFSINFRLREFACRCAERGLAKDRHWCGGLAWPHRELVVMLQALRSRLGRACIVTSGSRCPPYNAYVGGAPASYHMLGMAADIEVRGLTPAEVATEAKKIGFRGVAVYRQGFTHLDIRWPWVAKWWPEDVQG